MPDYLSPAHRQFSGAVRDPQIRAEQPRDFAAIRSINEAAFGRPDEATLVENLRVDGAALLSLVAQLEDRLVGHILFSRMWIESGRNSIDAVALAPMAILPQYQRQGIGGQLIQRGLEILRERRERIVIVLGHPDYYPRFGFSTGSARNLISPFPADAFMAMELVPAALVDVRGTIRYPAAFGI